METTFRLDHWVKVSKKNKLPPDGTRIWVAWSNGTVTPDHVEDGHIKGAMFINTPTHWALMTMPFHPEILSCDVCLCDVYSPGKRRALCAACKVLRGKKS